jgi:hypothetical protein
LKAKNKDDATFLMHELRKKNVEKVWAMLNKEIKMAKKNSENKTRFLGYTILLDFKKLHLLATYYRDKWGK